MRIKLISLGFAIVLALTTFTTSALAHECIVVSRSDVGSRNAANSANWFYVSTEELFAFVAQAVGGAQLTSGQLAWAVGEAQRQGAPTSFAIFTRKVLLEGTPIDGTAKMTDGKGIDHAFDWFPTFIAIYQAALQH